MLVGLDKEVPEDLGVIVPDYSFWFYPPVFTARKIVLSTYGAVYYRPHIVVSLCVLGPCELAAAAGDMSHGLCMLLAQPASGILHSVVDLVCHCPGVEGLLLSCHDQSLGVCSGVAFIEPLICTGHVCDFRHTFGPGTMQRLLLPGSSFIWLFPSGYKAPAFSHQWFTFCFSADIGLQVLLFLAHNNFYAVQTCSSFLLAYSLAVLNLGWDIPCMVLTFIVPMSVSFRSSRL